MVQPECRETSDADAGDPEGGSGRAAAFRRYDGVWGTGQFMSSDRRTRVQPDYSVWPLLAVGATVLIGYGDALRDGEYGLAAIVFVLSGCGLTWIAVSPRIQRIRTTTESARHVALVALVAAVVAAVRFGGGLYGSGRALSLSDALMIGAAVVALVLVAAGKDYAALVCVAVLVLGASVAMVISSPAPRIDTWGMYQAASRALLHWSNIYTAHWQPHVAGQASRFTYLPGSVIVLAPFYALLGDVRYGIIVAQLCSAFLITRVWPHRYASVFSVLLLLYPRFTYSVEQSWSEPLAVCVLLTFVLLARRGRSGWALVAFTVLLTLQQYDLVFVPLAAAWRTFGLRRTTVAVIIAGVVSAPWALDDPRAFFEATVSYPLHYVFAPQSLSVFHDLSTMDAPLAYTVLGVTAAASLIAGAVLSRRYGRLFAGCAIVVGTICLFGKIARFNEWQFVVALVLAAAAECLVQGSASSIGDMSKIDALPPFSQKGDTGNIVAVTS